MKCLTIEWDKVFKNGPSKICGRQPLKNLTTQSTQSALATQFFCCGKYV